MTTGTRRLLLDALRSCKLIHRYTAGLEIAAYQRDDLVRVKLPLLEASIEALLDAEMDSDSRS